MPKVTLVDYTGYGHPDTLYAARLLAFTKNTRLNMTPDGIKAFMKKPTEEILKEMEYMATTIPSSWEFVNCTFLFTEASRATAQQVTRTRTASFAMQSQRVSDMSDVTWDTPYEPNTNHPLPSQQFDVAMKASISNYSYMVEHGMPLEDARDLLPIGVHCNLVAQYNLRTIVDLCRSRESLRVQGPYVSIVRQMKQQVLDVWPWSAPFFVPKEDLAISMVEGVAKELAAMEGEKGAMYKGLSGKLAKAADLIKK